MWYLEEKPCVQTGNNACIDPTQADGTVLAMNLGTGQESAVAFQAGQGLLQGESVYIAPGDVWPLA